MWHKIQKIFQNWKADRVLRRQFNEYVSPELMESVVDTDNIACATAECRELEIVLVRVSEFSTEELDQTLRKVVGIGLEYEATVESLVSSLVVMSFGIHNQVPATPGRGEILADALLKQLSNQIAIVFSRRRCLVGNFGSNHRMFYGSRIPNFWDLLNKLSETDHGTKEEV